MRSQYPDYGILIAAFRWVARIDTAPGRLFFQLPETRLDNEDF
jgi:hypothetical protein